MRILISHLTCVLVTACDNLFPNRWRAQRRSRIASTPSLPRSLSSTTILKWCRSWYLAFTTLTIKPSTWVTTTSSASWRSRWARWVGHDYVWIDLSDVCISFAEDSFSLYLNTDVEHKTLRYSDADKTSPYCVNWHRMLSGCVGPMMLARCRCVAHLHCFLTMLSTFNRTQSIFCPF